jgi:hypothetical protein
MRPPFECAATQYISEPTESHGTLNPILILTALSLASVWQAQRAVKGRALDRALGRPPQLASVPELRFGYQHAPLFKIPLFVIVTV